MKSEDDFSKAVRGKFVRKNSLRELPMSGSGRARLLDRARAKAKGVDVNTRVNDLLKRDIELIEGTK